MVKLHDPATPGLTVRHECPSCLQVCLSPSDIDPSLQDLQMIQMNSDSDMYIYMYIY